MLLPVLGWDLNYAIKSLDGVFKKINYLIKIKLNLNILTTNFIFFIKNDNRETSYNSSPDYFFITYYLLSSASINEGLLRNYSATTGVPFVFF